MIILYRTHDEVFRVTTLIPFKVSVDFAEVGLAVLRGHDIFRHARLLLLKVNAQQHNGEVGLRSNDVEAKVPLGVCLTRAFGGEGKAEGVARLGNLYEFRNKGSALTAIDGYTAHPVAEDVVERTHKPLLLHHESRLATVGSNEEFADEEVKITGVGSHAINALVEVGDFNETLPTKHLVEDKFTDGLEHE